MTMQMTSRVINGEGVDFLEIDGKEVARVIEGIARSDIEDHLNSCDCEPNFNEYNENDLAEERSKKKDDIIDDIRNFLKNSDAIGVLTYNIIDKHLEGII